MVDKKVFEVVLTWKMQAIVPIMADNEKEAQTMARKLADNKMANFMDEDGTAAAIDEVNEITAANDADYADMTIMAEENLEHYKDAADDFHDAPMCHECGKHEAAHWYQDAAAGKDVYICTNCLTEEEADTMQAKTSDGSMADIAGFACSQYCPICNDCLDE